MLPARVTLSVLTTGGGPAGEGGGGGGGGGAHGIGGSAAGCSAHALSSRSIEKSPSGQAGAHRSIDGERPSAHAPHAVCTRMYSGASGHARRPICASPSSPTKSRGERCCVTVSVACETRATKWSESTSWSDGTGRMHCVASLTPAQSAVRRTLSVLRRDRQRQQQTWRVWVVVRSP